MHDDVLTTNRSEFTDWTAELLPWGALHLLQELLVACSPRMSPALPGWLNRFVFLSHCSFRLSAVSWFNPQLFMLIGQIESSNGTLLEVLVRILLYPSTLHTQTWIHPCMDTHVPVCSVSFPVLSNLTSLTLVLLLQDKNTGVTLGHLFFF